MTETVIIVIEVTSIQIKQAFPMETDDLGQGFENKILKTGSCEFSISYDGESELIAEILNKPADVEDQFAVDALKDFFSIS